MNSDYHTEHVAWVNDRSGYGKRCLATGSMSLERAIEATKPYVHIGETWVEERVTRIVYRAAKEPVCE
jgi:hypothetical protein